MVEVSTTVMGWAAIAAAGGTIYWICNRQTSSKGRGKNGRIEKKPIERKVSDAAGATGKAIKRKAEKVETAVVSAIDGAVPQDGEKKSKKKTKPKKDVSFASEEAAPTISSASTEEDTADDTSNLEFARQMSSAQTGVVAPAKSAASSKQKSVKQTKATTPVVEPTETVHIASDGDDDSSQAPSLPGIASSSKDVSDMLETPAAGPGSLRITAPTQPVTKKEKKVNAPAPTETKKQRQNRKKAEEKKAAREADEAERKKLEEAQRRTARIAEGRAAKDGQAFLAANPPAKSAWTASAASANGHESSSSSANNDLLDTFTESKPAPSTNGVKGIKANNMTPYASVPSEEDQIRMLQEDTEWQAVPSKKNKKSAAKVVAESTPAATIKESAKAPNAPVIQVEQQQPKQVYVSA